MEDRSLHFARWVTEALDAADISARQVEELTKSLGGEVVTKSTIYRWAEARAGTTPEAAKVVAFCRAVNRDPAEAYSVLGWTMKTPTPRQAPPPELARDIELVVRRYLDPSTSDAERYMIRETIHGLARRSRRGA